MTTPKSISSAQKLAARQYGVDLPDPESDPHTAAQRLLDDADVKDPGGWSTGSPADIVKSSHAALAVRRSRYTA